MPALTPMLRGADGGEFVLDPGAFLVDMIGFHVDGVFDIAVGGVVDGAAGNVIGIVQILLKNSLVLTKIHSGSRRETYSSSRYSF